MATRVEESMQRAWVPVMSALLLALAPPVAVHAQPGAKVSVGFLSANARAAMSPRIEAFQQGLRELGYVAGENILIEDRFADGHVDRLSALAADLVRLRVSVIVTEGATATRFAKEATSTIPIVMAQDPDPVGTGVVASLSRPGGNITGLSNLRPDLGGKRLQLLKETLPRLARVAVLGTSTTPGTAQTRRETEQAANAFGVQLQYVEVPGPGDIEPAFRAAGAGRADAVLVLASPVLLSRRAQIADLAASSRLPAMYYTGEFVRDGGLMSYGVNATDLFRRAATYVDRILRGAKPADLPVEQPTKFELVINVRTAKALGLTIPATVLARADEIIQ
jgi:putative tryptophan/tyrosine transport system substrate-binding protein